MVIIVNAPLPEASVSGITGAMENCSNLRSGIRKIAGVDAIEVTVEFTSGKAEYEWHTNTFIIGSSMYSFVGMTEIGKDSSEEYEAIINSIVILSDSAADGEMQEEDSEVPSEETESESEEISTEETSARTPTTGERNMLSRAKDYFAELVDRTIMNIENRGQYPSFGVFIKLVTMFGISVDQFIYRDSGSKESLCRKHIDVLLNSMNEKELLVMEATAEGLKKARETEVSE